MEDFSIVSATLTLSVRWEGGVDRDAMEFQINRVTSPEDRKTIMGGSWGAKVDDADMMTWEAWDLFELVIVDIPASTLRGFVAYNPISHRALLDCEEVQDLGECDSIAEALRKAVDYCCRYGLMNYAIDGGWEENPAMAPFANRFWEDYPETDDYPKKPDLIMPE